MQTTHQQQFNVQPLHIRETPVIAKDTINSLKSTLGLEPSRDIVERAAFEVSDRLSRLEHTLLTGELNKTAKLATSLVGISQQIGMDTFARIASDLVTALNNHDYVAVAAVSRRLIRQGEESLFTVVDYADDPICS